MSNLVESDCATVLLVEDDAEVGDAISEALRDHGYSSTRLANGNLALEWLRSVEEAPCLIVLDLMMPEMDGWEFRAQQKRDPVLASIPVLVLTAHGDFDTIDADAHARKPIELDDLLELIERFCGPPPQLMKRTTDSPLPKTTRSRG